MTPAIHYDFDSDQYWYLDVDGNRRVVPRELDAFYRARQVLAQRIEELESKIDE